MKISYVWGLVPGSLGSTLYRHHSCCFSSVMRKARGLTSPQVKSASLARAELKLTMAVAVDKTNFFPPAKGLLISQGWRAE